MSEGVKHDTGKLPYDLLAPEYLEGTADILAFGAEKYSKRYLNRCHALICAPDVQQIVVSCTQEDVAVLVTKDGSGQTILSLQRGSGKIVATGSFETPEKSKNWQSGVELTRQLEKEIAKLNGWPDLKNTASRKSDTTTRKRTAAPFAETKPPQGFTLTIVTTQGFSVACFAVDATTASECWETLSKLLSARSATWFAHDWTVAESGARNWEAGMAWSRPFAALMRHMWAWWRGEHLDAETGKSHLWHASCCLMFLVAYEARKTGKDDRPQN